MKELLLEFHHWRTLKGDDNNEIVGTFLFSLTPAERRQSGEKPGHEDCFWTEVGLSRFLASQPGWLALSSGAKLKAMFQHAVESILRSRQKLRQAPLVWTAGGRLSAGPPWDFGKIEFPVMTPRIIAGDPDPSLPRFAARKAAGLLE